MQLPLLLLLQCWFTSTEALRTIRDQDVQLDFYTAPELCSFPSSNVALRPKKLYRLSGTGNPGRLPRSTLAELRSFESLGPHRLHITSRFDVSNREVIARIQFRGSGEGLDGSCGGLPVGAGGGEGPEEREEQSAQFPDSDGRQSQPQSQLSADVTDQVLTLEIVMETPCNDRINKQTKGSNYSALKTSREQGPQSQLSPDVVDQVLILEIEMKTLSNGTNKQTEGGNYSALKTSRGQSHLPSDVTIYDVIRTGN